MRSEDETKYVKDWERIQKIGLYPEIKTPQKYLSRVAFGAAQAERYIKIKIYLFLQQRTTWYGVAFIFASSSSRKPGDTFEPIESIVSL